MVAHRNQCITGKQRRLLEQETVLQHQPARDIQSSAALSAFLEVSTM